MSAGPGVVGLQFGSSLMQHSGIDDGGDNLCCGHGDEVRGAASTELHR